MRLKLIKNNVPCEQEEHCLDQIFERVFQMLSKPTDTVTQLLCVHYTQRQLVTCGEKAGVVLIAGSAAMHCHVLRLYPATPPLKHTQTQLQSTRNISC